MKDLNRANYQIIHLTTRGIYLKIGADCLESILIYEYVKFTYIFVLIGLEGNRYKDEGWDNILENFYSKFVWQTESHTFKAYFRWSYTRKSIIFHVLDFNPL